MDKIEKSSLLTVTPVMEGLKCFGFKYWKNKSNTYNGFAIGLSCEELAALIAHLQLLPYHVDLTKSVDMTLTTLGGLDREHHPVYRVCITYIRHTEVITNMFLECMYAYKMYQNWLPDGVVEDMQKYISEGTNTCLQCLLS